MLYDLHGTPEHTPFPPVEMAEREPDGLLAVGGDLSVPRLLNAYRQGIFPWYNEGQPILWWSPDPRLVLFPNELHVSRSLRKLLKKSLFQVTFDTCFGEVIRACAQPRAEGGGTWLSAEMITAYDALHAQGFAHSVEVWQAGELVGGLYGVALGQVFFGESMFSRQNNASKVALATVVPRLAQNGCQLIDCQVYSAHLATLGARLLPRERFVRLLRNAIDQPMNFPNE